MKAYIIAALFFALLGIPALAQDPKTDVASTNVADKATNSDTVTVRDYVEALMTARDRFIDQRFTDSASAVDAALASINFRLAGVNEFRQTLTDQANNFATKDMLAALTLRLGDMQTRIEGLSSRLIMIESSGSPAAVQSTKDIQALSERISTIESQRDTTSSNLNWVLAAGAALAGIVLTWVTIRSRATPPNTTRT